MKKLKICFVTEDFYPQFIGGQGIYGFNLVTKLAKLGYKVTVLAENRVGRREFWGDWGVKVLLTPFCFGNQLILAYFEYFLFILRCKNIYFDILHANQLSALFFVLFKPKNVNKIVISVHNTNYDMAQKTNSLIKWILYKPLIWLEAVVYRKADGLLFNSPQEENDLLNYYQIRRKPTKSVYPGVEMPKFTEKERKQAQIKVRKDLGLPEDTKIILYVGRLVKRKKVDQILKAMKQLDGSVVAIIIGQGVERKNLEKIAPSNVKFLGFVKDIKPYFLAADCFVTVSEAEGGFLLSALEAASYGLPLILSPSAAGFPIINEGINGYIADSDDYKSLARKIIQVLKNSDRMGAVSRRVANKFTWERCAKNTVKFYQLVLQKDQDIF